MKRNEAEQWLKESLDKLDFTPPEHGWERLRATIERPEKKIFALPVWFNLKVAASVALVLTTGMLLYFLKETPVGPTPSYVSHERGAMHREEPSNQPSAVADKAEPAVPLFRSQTTALKTNKQIAATTQQRSTISDRYESAPTDRVEQTGETTIPRFEDPSQPMSITETSERTPELAFQESSSAGKSIDNRLNLGVAARFGTTSVGGLQYQVGIVAQKNITGKFFARATLAMATTDVKYTQQNSFERVSVFSALNASVDKKNVDVEYGGNILSIGLAPNVGFQVTSWLAVSCGLAIHHNLEQSLTRKNDEALAPEMLSNQIIDEQKSVGKWDAGLTGGASCRASRRLTIDLQYRYGLSTYLYFNGRPVRNSGLGVGINYLFRKD